MLPVPVMSDRTVVFFFLVMARSLSGLRTNRKTAVTTSVSAALGALPSGPESVVPNEAV
jgi:hypothetical protein